ncbi:AhpD-like protein [Gracilaria domingensis]|nr:AhpD-like protein [Gracilaria domingensis]
MAHRSSPNSPRTLTEALAPFALPESSFRQYIPFRNVMKRVLGEDVSFYPVMALSPVAVRTHIGLFRPSFFSPFVDFGLSTVTPDLLHTAFVASTSTFECAYCLAHGLVMGDMLSGAMEDQLRRGCPLPKYTVNPDADHLTPVQSAVIRLAIAVSKRTHTAPKHQLLPLCHNLSRLLGYDGSEVIKSILCFVGALNVFMGIMGVELEAGANAFASARAPELRMNFEPGIHVSAGQDNGSQIDHQPVKQSYIGGLLANFLGFVRLIPDVIAMMALEREIYTEIPTSNQALNDWVKHQFSGGVPQFISNIKRLGFKRAVCLGLQENVLGKCEENSGNIDNSEMKWRRKERCGLMYVYGAVVGCEEMCSVAKRLYRGSNTSDFESLLNNQECDTIWSSTFLAAKSVVEEYILKGEYVSSETIQWIMKEFPAEGVVEVASLISFLCFLHRIIMLFSDNKMRQ